MVGAIYQCNNYEDIFIFVYSGTLIVLSYSHDEPYESNTSETENDKDEFKRDLSILNDFLHSKSMSSGNLILKMKYQRSNDAGEMIQQVQKYNSQAKRMLKADNEKKMLDRFKNSEFEQVDDENFKNEDLTEINQIQKKPLEFWIRKAAAQLIVKKEEDENREKEKMNQIQMGFNILNPASSILNEEGQYTEKEGVANTQIVKNEQAKNIQVIKQHEKIVKLEGSNLQQTFSNTNLLGIYVSNSAQQNSTLPFSSNLPQLGSKANELSNLQSFQNGSNIIFNSNINNNHHNMTEDLIMQHLNSPKSNYDQMAPYSAKYNDKQNEEVLLSPQFSTLINYKFIDQKNGNYNESNQNHFQNAYQGNIESAFQMNSKDTDYLTPNSATDPERKNQLFNRLINNEIEDKASNRKQNLIQEDSKEIKTFIQQKFGDNELKEDDQTKQNDKDKQNSKLSKSKQSVKHASKQNLTIQDEKQEPDEPLIEYYPKRSFTIEQYKGVLFIKKKAEVFRKVTIGSFMEGDEIFVLLNIEKDFQVQEKKISQLRELLNQYESLYLQSLKCLKNLTYDAYLDIPKMEYEEKLKNNFETIWNKNNSLHLQLKVIINKIINLKDVLNLQKSIKRNKLHFENIYIIDLLNELKCDFKSILEERNVTLTIQNPSNINMIKNSPKRVKQVLFNLIHNAIKNTESEYSVLIIIDYQMENKKIVQFHIINKIKQNIIIPAKDDIKLDIKEILKGATKASSKRSKTKKDRRKNILQIGLRVSNKILNLIGPKNGLIMKKVDNTFQTQIHIFSDASQGSKNEKLTRKEKEQKEKQDEVIRFL